MLHAVSAFTEPAFAWEPITPRGVAAFARASFERLFVVQAVVALLGAAAVVWLLSDGIFPTIDAAIGELPEAGQIHSGKLDWRDDSPGAAGGGTNPGLQRGLGAWRRAAFPGGFSV